MMNQIAKFWIPEAGVGKGRPSIHWHHGQTYVDYSESYKSWLNHAAQIIESQSRRYLSPTTPVRVECSFVNFLSSDSDNLQGAVLDALVGIYLEGDSSQWVTGSRGKFCKTRKRRGYDKEVGILVEVYPGEIVELEPGFSSRFVLPEFLSTSPVRRRTKGEARVRGVGKKTREKLLNAELSKSAIATIDLEEPDLVAQFWIPGRGVGKARPYLHRHGDKLIKTYSRNYTNWMDYAKAIIRYYSRSYAAAPRPARVEIKCVNFLSSDIDNLQGSPLDCLSKIYLGGDSSSYLIDSSGQFCKVRKRRGHDKEVGMLINIYPGKIEELEPGFSDEFNFPLSLVSSF